MITQTTRQIELYIIHQQLYYFYFSYYYSSNQFYNLFYSPLSTFFFFVFFFFTKFNIHFPSSILSISSSFSSLNSLLFCSLFYSTFQIHVNKCLLNHYFSSFIFLFDITTFHNIFYLHNFLPPIPLCHLFTALEHRVFFVSYCLFIRFLPFTISLHMCYYM